jgi:hypothetical protein
MSLGTKPSMRNNYFIANKLVHTDCNVLVVHFSADKRDVFLLLLLPPMGEIKERLERKTRTTTYDALQHLMVISST